VSSCSAARSENAQSVPVKGWWRQAAHTLRMNSSASLLHRLQPFHPSYSGVMPPETANSEARQNRKLQLPWLYPLLWQRHKTKTFTVWRIIAKPRMLAKLKTIQAELRSRKHDRISEVGDWLQKVVLGYYQYHAVPGNTDQLRAFRQRINRRWRNVLIRRSQCPRKKLKSLTKVFDRWLPSPRILHPYPDARFYATHPS